MHDEVRLDNKISSEYLLSQNFVSSGYVELNEFWFEREHRSLWMDKSNMAENSEKQTTWIFFHPLLLKT